MEHRTPTLLEMSLSEQNLRNAAAIAAIHARAAEITELQHLAEALAARGANVRPSVATFPAGILSECRLYLWLSCTEHELSTALDWLIGADISVTRLSNRDTGRMRSYQLALRGQVIMLNATVHDRVTPATFDRVSHPASA